MVMMTMMMVMMMGRAVIWGVGMAGWEDQSPIEGKAPVRGVDNYLHSSGNYHNDDDFDNFDLNMMMLRQYLIEDKVPA